MRDSSDLVIFNQALASRNVNTIVTYGAKRS
jgi:hypothetical protein